MLPYKKEELYTEYKWKLTINVRGRERERKKIKFKCNEARSSRSSKKRQYRKKGDANI